MAFYYLLFAIIAEIIATSTLKLTKGFTLLWPSLFCSLIYMVCHYYFAKAIQELNLGVAYALWCGLGILLTVFVSLAFYKESISLTGLIGILLILSGCLLVNLGGS
ncbi:quaternary ammonium transporter [Streptococcus bovimastitidis]|uniref:Quaternary ammonium transporter n=1 Tax=Streptococcus bovimastitidis TaxID=1856638 RepID=A0A1L8MKP5_9STRE|nr:multidrug efflux SMR transporter [Streptococcus bovimastitidis]OJF71296.1 quaternary ammonium transporter [Streptococcus bovimastitidis]